MMDYQIIRSSRKTISLQITPEGKLVVRCPNRMKRLDIQAFVESKRNWIEKHLQKSKDLSQPVLTEEELRGARKTLTAAALTYVDATAVALAQLLRLIAIFGGSRRRRD